MDKLLKIYSQEYIEKVNFVCKLMLSGLGLNSKEELIRYREKRASGNFELNGNNMFVFHGRGCKFNNKSICIDWDFGYNCEWCGLNPSLLAAYIEYSNNSLKFRENEIREIFEKAMYSGEMYEKYGLYYLI